MEYRVPNIDEFIQGFKFEVLEYKKGTKLGSIFFMDSEYNKKYGKDIYAEDDNWKEHIVWWDREPKTITKKYGEIECTYKELPEFDWVPWGRKDYIRKLLNEGRIRTTL